MLLRSLSFGIKKGGYICGERKEGKLYFQIFIISSIDRILLKYC